MSEAEGSGEEWQPEEGDEVWLGDQSVSGEEFIEALNAVHEVQEHMRDLQRSLDDLDTGLDREDAVALIYGRNYELGKRQVESAFEVMDVIIEEPPENIAPRLMADKTADLTISEAAEVWDDIVALAEKYGSEEQE